jgi:uncharacterized protein YbjT (DUF2867 family)
MSQRRSRIGRLTTSPYGEIVGELVSHLARHQLIARTRRSNVQIAVYGASGYQGKLVLAELAHRNIGMRLVGRHATRLREAATTVGMVGVEQRVADTDDHDALVAAFRECDAVINCAGPFTRSGPAVVRAAIAAGCHYVDTAGEQRYVREVFDSLDGDAARAGVSVLPAANDGCVPTDLLAGRLAAVARSLRLAVEERPFRPHLTLGRWRPGRPAGGRGRRRRPGGRRRASAARPRA